MRKLISNIFTRSFSTTPNTHPLNSTANPMRISFQVENRHFLDEVLALDCDKTRLQSSHSQFLQSLTAEEKRAKPSFDKVQHSVKDLYDYIKRDILVQDGFDSQSEFIQRAHYYFQSEGKKVRPTMVEMMADCMGEVTPPIAANVRKWGALIETMHIASLAHDDIIDDSPSRRGVESQHLKYGKRSAVFSANFIISKASATIYDFGNPRLFQIYSVAMENLATGEIIQAVTKNKVNETEDLFRAQLETYLHKSYYKTAALMANALQAVPVLFPSSTATQEEAAFRVGQHLGIAFQLIDDVMDYTSTAQEMGKEGLADIVAGNVTGPVYLSLWAERKRGGSGKFMLDELRNRNKTKAQAEQIKEWVMRNSGIELTRALAAMHVQRGLSFLKHLPNSDLPLWQYLSFKILSRNK